MVQLSFPLSTNFSWYQSVPLSFFTPRLLRAGPIGRTKLTGFGHLLLLVNCPTA
jgi:hypothetical protein